MEACEVLVHDRHPPHWLTYDMVTSVGETLPPRLGPDHAGGTWITTRQDTHTTTEEGHQ
jgi:hypothetical protein